MTPGYDGVLYVGLVAILILWRDIRETVAWMVHRNGI